MKYRLSIQTPPYVMLSSDYASQEPRITAVVSSDQKMIKSFSEGKDIYATIASFAFNKSYEECLEFHPETHEYQKEGKARRTEAKSIVLGILYGRSTKTIGEQLYGHDESLTEEARTKKAQGVYNSVLQSFPNLKSFMANAQQQAKTVGYVETILGRRRHIPDMMLPEFEFEPMPKYVNPDIDPMNPETLKDQNTIPKRITDKLEKEFKRYKYFGQVVKRTKELKEENIRVINNRPKITDASRQCVNCVDTETEILTLKGWKKYNEFSVKDEILAFDIESQSIVRDCINDILVYNGQFDSIEFKSKTFTSVSTINHRWVSKYKNYDAKFITTEKICSSTCASFPILRVADNKIISTCEFSDNELKLIGWLMTDGEMKLHPYCVRLYQSTRRQKNEQIYKDMTSTLNLLGINYSDSISKHDNKYHAIYIYRCDLTLKLLSLFPNRVLTFEFVSTLNQHQAYIIMCAMLDGDGSGIHINSRISYFCDCMEKRDVFQYLAFVSGYATNVIDVKKDICNNYKSKQNIYDSVSNDKAIKMTKDGYDITVLRRTRAHIYPQHISHKQLSKVWCVSTNTGSWIARHHGHVFITGNSIVQGSAADLTKMAILNLCNNAEWQRLGGRLLTPIHDELLCEVPMENWEKGGEVLANCMCEAADFMPFGIKCDVETTLRWYGNEYPCQYPKPALYPTNNEEEIKWIQWHLLEMEYILPIIPDENGEEPRGDGARGINGIITEEYMDAVENYIKTYHISTDIFIEHIKNKAEYGI